jgi:hypothetical protein
LKKNRRFAGSFITLVVLSVLLVSSCNKKPEQIGLELLESEQKFVGTDTAFIVSAYSTVEDSVITDETSLNLLGSMITNTFGKTTTSFYTQIRLSTVSPDFGDNPVADSAVLTLVYNGYYGNILTQQHLTVYKVTEDFYLDSSYYSNSYIEYDSLQELSDFYYVPNPENIIVDSVEVPGRLRIPLNDYFSGPMLNPDNYENFTDKDKFVDFFKGLYIKSEIQSSWTGSVGAILYFDLLDANSNVQLYYHNDSVDSLSYTFNINLNSARVGRFIHDYSMSKDETFKQMIINGDTSLGSEKLYLQSLGGVKTLLSFPGLSDWVQSDIVTVNEAKLILPVVSSVEDYGVPGSLVLFNYNENGELTPPLDWHEGEAYFGGKYFENINAYQYRLTYHIQSLLNGEPDNGMVLFSHGKSINADCVELSGTDRSLASPIILKITYTKLN